MTTISTSEHLTLIKSFCERNLALAEKRTPGKWELGANKVVRGDETISSAPLITEKMGSGGRHDGLFFAACAGGAEAGWKATIAAVKHAEDTMNDHLANEILTAYPMELLGVLTQEQTNRELDEQEDEK